jgi:hypothetical protein
VFVFRIFSGDELLQLLPDENHFALSSFHTTLTDPYTISNKLQPIKIHFTNVKIGAREEMTGVGPGYLAITIEVEIFSR